MAAWKVGLLVVIFVGLLLGSYAVLGRSLFSPKTDRYYVEMPDASGVVEGSRVMMAGVQIGTVQKVALLSPRLARLEIAVKRDAKVPTGTVAQTSGSLMSLGDTPLQLLPGRGPDEIPVDAVIPGARLNALEALMPGAKEMMVGLKDTLQETKLLIADTRKIVNDREMQDSIKRLLASTERTVSQYGELANQITGVVNKNEAKLGEALQSATLAMSDIRKSTKAVADLVADGKLSDKTLELIASLTAASDKAGKLVEDLSSFVNDPELREPLKNVAKNTEEITASGARAAKDVEKMAKDGTEITANTKELTSKANDLADETKTILQQLQKILGGGTINAPKVNFNANLDVLRDNSLGRFRTDLEGTVRFGDVPVRFGVYDAFEGNKVILQTSRPLTQNAQFYYGIYASKPGFGVEYEVARGLLLRGDLFDLNNPRVDLRARYSLGSGFYGWLGVNQVLKHNSLVFGLGIRK